MASEKITLSLDKTLVAQSKEYAESTQRKISGVVALALREFLKKEMQDAS